MNHTTVQFICHCARCHLGRSVSITERHLLLTTLGKNDLVVFAPTTPTIQLRIARWESFLLTLYTVKSSRPGSDYRTFQILINCEISLSHIKKDTLYRCFISNLKPAHTTRLHHTPQDIIRIIMPVGAMHHLSCELNSLYKHWHSAVKKQKRVWMRK